MSDQNLNPWSREAWASGSSNYPQQPGYEPVFGQQATATFTANPADAGAANAPRKSRSKLAGIIAVAVLAGAAGGGGAAYGVASYLGAGQSSTGVTTQVVQADPSNPDWTTVAEAASKAVASVTVTSQNGAESLGSGVVIDTAGHIVTNNHVVSGVGTGASIIVTLDDVAYQATVVGTDAATDLAVLQLADPPADLSVMSFADSSALQVGDEVMAIGNPLGLDNTATTGIISALNRPVTTEATTDNSPVSHTSSSDVVVTAAIQTNAAINPGNSGGALINSSGELIGITSSIASLSSGESSSSESGSIGLGFAIPANQVSNVVDQLISSGTAQHPQIGISAQDVTGTGQLGAQVTNVTSGSPADQAGIRSGDLITAVDGNAVTSAESLVALVRATQVGQEITVTVERDGQSSDLTVTTVAASK
ncbi:trypsin-like peptidase domain-containing protein [Propionimicrobium sp. PCR01-08-3]|uniref:S1C family serine protease n=1 Tax=Propionimicrobium sp. PCR01-08-3 TaxID=3052086 RepID=UPI00255CBDA0|nr:trypsin-like peptidase domain-containing protein [Propionimicrobium sp. PCR01-08-3]WIY81465.1 trypsin-like peptidase domain-containing protein [Propionimicrobium sp. PCR01-08-3]